MTKDEQLSTFYDLVNAKYNDLKKKYKQFCFLNHFDWSEDTFQDSILKVAEKIKKNGITAKTEKEIENYFFKSYKFNTFQQHLQDTKKKVDENANLGDVDIEDSIYDESELQYNDFVKMFFERTIKENFDTLTYSLWRMRYLLKIDGKNLNYKTIKKITKVQDTRSRIVSVNRWIRDNITPTHIRNEYNNNSDKYLI